MSTFIEADRGFARSHSYLEAMTSRRSVRQFNEKLVNEDLIFNAIRSAGLAPSGANSQPWFFAVIRDQSMKDFIRAEAEKVERAFYESKASSEWLNDLKPLGTNATKSYLSDAPYLIAIFSKHRISSESGEPQTYYPIESVGIATGILLSSLHLAGLATLTHTPKPMAFLNQCLDLDRSYRPFMLVVTGYAKDNYVGPDLTKKSFSEICKLY